MHAAAQVAPGAELSLGQRLRAVAASAKSCDADAGGCGRLWPVQTTLVAAPPCFALLVAWAVPNEDPADIGATLAALQEVCLIWLGASSAHLR
jgi:hypothetical protein